MQRTPWWFCYLDDLTFLLTEHSCFLSDTNYNIWNTKRKNNVEYKVVVQSVKLIPELLFPPSTWIKPVWSVLCKSSSDWGTHSVGILLWRRQTLKVLLLPKAFCNTWPTLVMSESTGWTTGGTAFCFTFRGSSYLLT